MGAVRERPMHDPEPDSIPGLSRELPSRTGRARPGAPVAAAEPGPWITTTPGFVFASEFVSGARGTLPSGQPPSALPRAAHARSSCESLGTLP